MRRASSVGEEGIVRGLSVGEEGIVRGLSVGEEGIVRGLSVGEEGIVRGLSVGEAGIVRGLSVGEEGISERRGVRVRHNSFLQQGKRKVQRNSPIPLPQSTSMGSCCFPAMLLFVLAIVYFPGNFISVARPCVRRCDCISARKKNGFDTNSVVDTAVPDPRKILISRSNELSVRCPVLTLVESATT